MKIRYYEIAVLCAGAYLFLGTLGFGQAQAKSKENIKPRDAQSGMATGKSLQSAHAVETVNAAPAGDQQKSTPAQTKPSHEEGSSISHNPLFEGKSKASAPTSGKSHEVVEYKDPEDMTTRYRPGNNKTTRTADKSETNGATPKQ